MTFVKGNTQNKKRQSFGAGTGRPRNPIKPELDAIARDKMNVPRYLERLSTLALTSKDDKLAFSALTYLIDRHEGKAKQVQDLNVHATPFNDNDYEVMAKVKLAEERLINEGKLLTMGEGIDIELNGTGDLTTSESAEAVPVWDDSLGNGSGSDNLAHDAVNTIIY